MRICVRVFLSSINSYENMCVCVCVCVRVVCVRVYVLCVRVCLSDSVTRFMLSGKLGEHVRGTARYTKQTHSLRK